MCVYARDVRPYVSNKDPTLARNVMNVAHCSLTFYKDRDKLRKNHQQID